MSVISILERTTEDKFEFESFKMSDNSKVFCDSKKLEPFSIILSVGERWAANISRDNPTMYLVNDKSIEIPAHSSVIIEVSEYIMIPYNVFGTIVQKGAAFLEDGLIVASGKVDPSFSGKLQVLIFNTTKKIKKIKVGEEIGNLILFRTDSTLNSAMHKQEQTSKVKEVSSLEKIKKFFISDMKYTINLIVTILTSSIVTFFMTMYFIKDQKTNNDNHIKIQKNVKNFMEKK